MFFILIIILSIKKNIISFSLTDIYNFDKVLFKIVMKKTYNQKGVIMEELILWIIEVSDDEYLSECDIYDEEVEDII